MGARLIISVVVEALDCGVVDRAVHTLGVAVDPTVFLLRVAVLMTGSLGHYVEERRPGVDSVAVSI